MSEYKVRVEKGAAKTLKKMDPYQAKIIMGWIRKNLIGTINPRQHGKALRHEHSDKWRYRVGDYRLISHIDDSNITILILEIGHRRDIY